VVPKGAQDTVAAVVRSIFSAPDHASAMIQLHEVSRMLAPKFPQAAELLEGAAEDVLAHMHFPSRTPTTAALDQPDRAAAQRGQAPDPRRRDLPDPDSLMRMVGTLLAEQDDEWQVADRRYFSIGSMAEVDGPEGGEDPTELLAAIA
jgi:putative transposase